MDSKGQASAEYLLLILVILIVMGFIVTNLVSPSISSSMAVSQVSDAKTAVSTIANAVNVVYANGPGSKRTVSVYIPQATTLTANNKVIGMNINYEDGANGTVTKYVNTTVPYNLIITNPNLSKNWYDITITWSIGSSAITVNCTPKT